MAGREDDAAHGLDLADHTGHSWGGHDAILTNHEVVDLREGKQIKRKNYYEEKFTYTSM